MLSFLKKNLKFDAVKDVGIYLSSNIFKATLPFIILPILTLYLSPTEYGVWNLYLALMAFILPLTACGLPMVIARNYHKHDAEEHAKMVSTALTCITGFSFVVLGIIALYGQFETTFLSIPVIALLALPFLCLCQNIQYFNKIILVHENRAKFFAAIDISNVTALRFGGVLAVIFIAANWFSLLYANIIIQFLFAILAFYLLARDNRLCFEWDTNRAKGLLSMGWPLIGHTIGAIILTLSDRIILEKMTDLETVGLYSLGANLGTGVFIVCTAFNQKWGPWLYRQLKNPTDDQKRRIVRYSYLYFIGAIITGIAVTIIGLLYIDRFIDNRYQGASIYIAWIAAGSTLHGMSLAIAHYVTIEGKTRMLPLVTGTAAILNIILTITLINMNGAVGAAQATFISYFYLFLAMWWLNHKTYPMPWMEVLKK